MIIDTTEELIELLTNHRHRVIIFLDIDGVLNTADSVRCLDECPEMVIQSGKLPGDVLDLRNLLLLEALVGRIRLFRGNPMIIGVSSWFTKQEHVKMFNDMVEPNLYMMAKAMFTGGGRGRGNHVLELVSGAKSAHYIIIDDAGDNMYDLDEPKIRNHLLQVDGRVGLSALDCIKAMEIVTNREKW